MTIAILGAGVMGEAVLAGLIGTQRGPTEVIVSEGRPERAAELRERYGVEIVDNAEAARRAETLVLVVKPQDVPTVLDEISGIARPGQLVISMAAGITTATIEARLADGVGVARVMPNTPALVGAGMAAIAAGTHCSDEQLALAEGLLEVTGKVVRVPEEQLDAVTAVSGSGPAYVFLVTEAMTEAGIALGLPPDTAGELAVQTVIGSAQLMRETGDEPSVLRQRVTSPGGTTAAALNELEERDLRGTFAAALERARDRGRELAKGSDV
jgi:pyrroline-5-carboxylate reductase